MITEGTSASQRVAPHGDERQREDQQQHDVERQDVEKGRLELQHQRLDHRDVRMFEEIADPHLLVVHRVVEGADGVRDLGDEDDEQKDMSDIELPGAAHTCTVANNTPRAAIARP